MLYKLHIYAVIEIYSNHICLHIQIIYIYIYANVHMNVYMNVCTYVNTYGGIAYTCIQIIYLYIMTWRRRWQNYHNGRLGELVLLYAHVYSRMLTHVDVCLPTLTSAGCRIIKTASSGQWLSPSAFRKTTP